MKSGSSKGGMKSNLKIADSALQDFKTARLLVKDMVADPRIGTFSEMCTIITRNAPSTRALDRSFVIELKVLEKSKDMLEDAIKKQLLSFLPSADKHVTLQQCMRSLLEFQERPLVMKAPAGAGGQIASFHEVCANMTRAISPNTDEAAVHLPVA